MDKYMNFTSPQENIYLLHNYYVNTSIASLCGAVMYDGFVEEKALRRAVTDVITGNDVFRIRISDEKGGRQYYAENETPVISSLCFSDENEFNRYADTFSSIPVTSCNVPLYRFVIFRIGSEKTGILAALSHLIADAWSFALMVQRIDEALARPKDLTEGESRENPEYLAFIESEANYRSSERFIQDLRFWMDRYPSWPEATSIKKESGSLASSAAYRYEKRLNEKLSTKIRHFCKTENLSPAVIFEAAVFCYLSYINPENRTLTIGIPVLNRNKLSEKKTVGMFISTTVLTVENRKSISLREFASTISREHVSIFRHQRFPYAELLKNLRSRYGAEGGLCDVMVSFQNARTETKAETRWYFNGYSEIPLSIHIDDRDNKGTWTMTLDAQTEVFPDRKEIELLSNRILFILEQIIERPDKRITDISILPDAERLMILRQFNSTSVSYPPKSVNELFTEKAAVMPDHTALVFKDLYLTYRQTDQMSNALAHFLLARGLDKNNVVAVIMKRDWRIIISMIGIMKAGCVCMILSPDYPADRIRTMLDISKTRMVLCYGYESDLPVEKLDLENYDFSERQEPLKVINRPDDLCYIIFTSGSTGTPKAAALTHCNLANYICYSERFFRGVKQSVSATIPTFDGFMQDTLAALCCGKTVILASEEQAVNPVELWKLANRYDHSFMFLTPTRWQTYLKLDRSLKKDAVSMFCGGGEAFTKELYYLLHELNPDGVVINDYGPSETTISTTVKFFRLDSPSISGNDITIGTPIANSQAYILNEKLELLPVGIAGELCIAGTGVGKGYLNQPELTHERFITNPFSAEVNHHGKILYRTGDLAKWRPDGEIDYLGRIDTQVKIRGLRIELGEIENVMSSVKGIISAVAEVKKDSSGRQYLVGYYTADCMKDETVLRDFLLSKLPRYMVPNYFIRLDKIPMTPSGKVDRKHLYLPEKCQSPVRICKEPETPEEKMLCALMQKILRAERIGVNDNFFELGGDSLGAISFVSMAHEQGIEIRLQDFYVYPTVSSLLRHIHEKKNPSGLKEGKERTWSQTLKEKDFDKYKPLLSRNISDSSFVLEKRDLGNILLTGATGFLGAHILQELLQKESGKIYCLIRESESSNKEKRLLDMLNWYFDGKYTDMIGQRIIAVGGDIDRFGLSDELPSDISTVIHAAATVKHYGPYHEFRKINVEGTINASEVAIQAGADLIHISTASVGGSVFEEKHDLIQGGTSGLFKETDLYIGQNLDNVYLRSKFEAEQAVLNRILAGRLKAKIIRIGNLTNRQGDFRFQPNYSSNAFLRHLKAIIELGLFPDKLLNMYTEFSPVDMTADGIVRIGQYGGNYNVFHLFSDRPIKNDRMLQMMAEEGISLTIVSWEKFLAEVEKTLREEGRSYIYESLQNIIRQDSVLAYESVIHPSSDFSVWFLEKTGFSWKDIDPRYFGGYINYFRKSGYLHV